MLVEPQILAVINLAVQTLLLGVVGIAAYLAKEKKQLIKHCRIIRVAMAVQLLSVVLIMMPSFAGSMKIPAYPLLAVARIHSLLGFILIALWIYINLFVKWKVKVIGGSRKVYMRVASSLWVIVYLLGVYIYLATYILP